MRFKSNLRNFRVIIFFTFIVGLIVDSSEASNQCKNKVMNIVMKKCNGLRTRSKRDLQELSIQLYPGKQLVHHLSRRLVEDTADGIIRVKASTESPIIDIEVPPSPETADVPRVVGKPHPRRSFIGLLDQEANFGGDLGLDLSTDEANDLYKKLSKRLPRELKDEEMQKMFFRLAAECCRHDDDSCFESTPLLKCV